MNFFQKFQKFAQKIEKIKKKTKSGGVFFLKQKMAIVSFEKIA